MSHITKQFQLLLQTYYYCWLIIDESLATQNLFWYRVWGDSLLLLLCVKIKHSTIWCRGEKGHGIFRFITNIFSHGAIARCFRESANGALRCRYVKTLGSSVSPASVHDLLSASWTVKEITKKKKQIYSTIQKRECWYKMKKKKEKIFSFCFPSKTRKEKKKI